MADRDFSVRHRGADLADATATEVDVLVVGLGATGAGVALDAASRGLSVVAVDRGDLAAGTSSKSSKLVHGGLRYLENYEFSLVREGVTERQVLMRLAPHLVRPMDFLYPVWPDTAKRRLLGLGLSTYDVFALASMGGLRGEVRRHGRTDRDDAIALAPALAGSDFAYSYVYGDSATDDARLVLAVVREARRFGAVTLTHAGVTGLLRDPSGTVRGARVTDHLDGGTHEVRARHVVNATGVWVDDLMGMAEPGRTRAVMPSKGVHVVVDRERLPLTSTAVLLPSKQGDGRSMFAIPWGAQTILGTTDTAYDGDLDALTLTAADLDYVLAAGNAVFGTALAPADVVGAWAGVRPLLREEGTGSMSDVSRRHTLIAGAGGLITITGGKLTTYRRMAKDVVDLVVSRDHRRARCRTDTLPLGIHRPLAEVAQSITDAAVALRLPASVAGTLLAQSGEDALEVLGIVAADPSLSWRLSPSTPHIAAEVVQAARHEGAATLDDVFSRRLRLSLRARDAGLPAALPAARLIAAETGRDEAWAREQVAAYTAAVAGERGVVPIDSAGPPAAGPPPAGPPAAERVSPAADLPR